VSEKRPTSIGGALVPQSRRVSVISGAGDCAIADMLMKTVAKAPIVPEIRVCRIVFPVLSLGCRPEQD
jgi:hypothetical protein